LCNFGIHSLWEGRSIEAGGVLGSVPDDEFRLWFRGCGSFVTPLHRKHTIVLFAALVCFVSRMLGTVPPLRQSPLVPCLECVTHIPRSCCLPRHVHLPQVTGMTRTMATSPGQRLRCRGFLLGRSNRTTGVVWYDPSLVRGGCSWPPWHDHSISFELSMPRTTISQV
jgi:hypothetical protein